MNVPAGHPEETPLILFGAFDRHNLGDLLLGRVAQALMFPRPVVFSGLAARNLTLLGGTRVRPIGELAHEWGGRPADIVHVGGEILTCSLYEAAVMLQSERRARIVISRHDSDPCSRHAWAAAELGLDQAIAYQLPPALFRNCRFVGYLGAGGVGLSTFPAKIRDAVVKQLAASDFVWVRDAVTHRTLDLRGVPSLLAPDPCELVAEIFGGALQEKSESSETIATRYPHGYLAVQFSADYGDDATLETIGRSLCRIQREQNCHIVLFRAGAAPWHDSLAVYSRLISLMAALDATIFDSLQVLDLCVLLANSRGFIGSSLHGRIVAEAFGRVAVSLVRGDPLQSKVGIYVDTWRPERGGTVVHADSLEKAFLLTRETTARRLQQSGQSGHLPDLAMAAANRCRCALGLAPLERVTSIQT